MVGLASRAQRPGLMRIEAWVAARNAAGATVEWQFTAADARVKLRRLMLASEFPIGVVLVSFTQWAALKLDELGLERSPAVRLSPGRVETPAGHVFDLTIGGTGPVVPKDKPCVDGQPCTATRVAFKPVIRDVMPAVTAGLESTPAAGQPVPSTFPPLAPAPAVRGRAALVSASSAYRRAPGAPAPARVRLRHLRDLEPVTLPENGSRRAHQRRARPGIQGLSPSPRGG